MKNFDKTKFMFGTDLKNSDFSSTFEFMNCFAVYQPLFLFIEIYYLVDLICGYSHAIICSIDTSYLDLVLSFP